MKKKNDFEKMCERLENKRDFIMDARKEVEAYVGKDYDKFLQLEAEAEDVSYMDYCNTQLALGAFVISVLSIFYDDILKNIELLFDLENGLNGTNVACIIASIVLIVSAVIVGIIPLAKSLKYRKVGKWRKYIKIVLEDMKNSIFTLER